VLHAAADITGACNRNLPLAWAAGAAGGGCCSALLTSAVGLVQACCAAVTPAAPELSSSCAFAAAADKMLAFSSLWNWRFLVVVNVWLSFSKV
jgi:hypothetical protein